MFFQQKTEKISRVKKIKSFFQDRYHLLFKGAAENHLRIQNALKNPDGTYQLTIKFDSYTDLKKYQKKLRRMTVSLSGALAMMIVAVIVAPYVMNPNKSAAANFIWIQNSWAGTAGATAATKSGWTGYASKDASITAGATVSLTQSTPSLTGDGTTDYGGLASTPPAGFFVDVSDANNKKLALKKTNGSGCAATAECASTGGTCTGSVCVGLDGTSCFGNTGCVHGFCSSSVCTNTLIAGYHFNEASGSTSADFSGNSKTLSLTAATSTASTTVSGFPVQLTTGTYIQTLSVPVDSLATLSWSTAGYSSYSMYINGTYIGVWGGEGGTPAVHSISNISLNAGSNQIRIDGVTGYTIYYAEVLTGGALNVSYLPKIWNVSDKKYGSSAVTVLNNASIIASPAIDLGNSDWTIFAWVKPAAISNGNTLFSDSTGANSISLAASGAVMLNGITTSTILSSSAFTHLVIKKTGTNTITIYSNGVANSTTYSWPGSSIYLIGTNVSRAGTFGTIDDLLFFKRAFSDAEVAAIYNKGAEFTW